LGKDTLPKKKQREVFTREAFHCYQAINWYKYLKNWAARNSGAK